MAIIDGKKLAEDCRAQLKQIVASLGYVPVLAVVSVGDDKASKIYVRNKEKAAAEVGIKCDVYSFSDVVLQPELESLITRLNQDKTVHGIIVQQPLPKSIDGGVLLDLISAEKDVDGFGVLNAGRLLLNEKGGIVAATPKGILRILEATGEPLVGKHAVIIGRSKIVGRPLAALLLNHHCTVTVAHSKTQNLPEICQVADILIAACGQPKMVKKNWVKKGAIVIDVGINRDENGKICGDVDFDDVVDVAKFISPVPGGVGPMTVAMLLENTVQTSLVQTKEN